MDAFSTFVVFWTITRKEVVRFSRIWSQTLLPSAITQTLYFLIFGSFIGSQLASVDGVSYMAFIVPGLIMMAVITNAYMNVASSFFGAKFQRNIEEIMISPAPYWAVLGGYLMGGILRGLLVGLIVFAVSWAFVHPQVAHPWLMMACILLTALIFSLGGFINGIFARKFDDVGIVPTFVLTPLTYLGWVFYSLSLLQEPWHTISLFNPIVYMVDAFRFSFYGTSHVLPAMSFALLVGLSVVLGVWALWLLKRGTGMRN